MEMENNQTVESLQSHVAHLASLVERVNTLRKIPGLLLAPSTLTGSQLEQGFDQINDLKTAIGSSVTQDYIKHAHESFSKNEEDVGLEARRQSRKRRRPPSPVPESPRPPPALPKHTFPPSSRLSPLTPSALPSYVREHNRAEKTVKLHIWTPTKPQPQAVASASSPFQSREIVVRVSIRDVLYGYVRLDVADAISHHHHAAASENCMDEDRPEGRVIVESVTIFGPRERKSPHSQSDYMVFQKLSQHIAWMVQAEPDVELQSLLALFKSYETLFVSQCTTCHRVLSEEGHFPPVCRIWTPIRKPRDGSAVDRESGTPADVTDGKWEPRHRACLM